MSWPCSPGSHFEGSRRCSGSLFLSSLPGMLIAAELGVVFWLVYGGLAGIGMPGLFWNPDAWTMMRTSLGRDALRLLDALPGVRARLRGTHARARATDLAPFSPGAGGERPARACSSGRSATTCMVDGLRWFLAYAGLPALLALAIPAVLPAARPGGGRVVVEWPWLAGMALGIGSDRRDRDHASRNPASRSGHAARQRADRLSQARRPRSRTATATTPIPGTS